MAHPGKAARKTRTLAKAKRSLALDCMALTGQLKDSIEKNQALLALALQERNKATHLARLVTYLVAQYGEKGSLTISGDKLDQIPDAAKLQEYYTKETNEIQLVSVIENDEDNNLDAIVALPQPKIEIVRA